MIVTEADSAEAGRAAMAAVVVALTGTRPQSALPGSGVEGVLAWLRAQDWDAERLAGLRDATRQRQERWPLTVPAELLQVAGAARANALLQQCVTALGLDRVPARARSGHGLDARDRALLAERPPHHGSVG